MRDYCKTLHLHCMLVLRFRSAEASWHFNLAFSLVYLKAYEVKFIVTLDM